MFSVRSAIGKLKVCCVLSIRYIKTTGYDLRLKTGKGYPSWVPTFLFYQIKFVDK
jgi:hypothetical protein